MAPSLQDIIRQRQSAAFYGREAPRADFRANLARPPEDPQRRFVYVVHGSAGVGKSLLLREFEGIARDHGALTARLDEDATTDVPDALNAIAAELAEQGVPVREFTRRHTDYQRARSDLLAAGDAPADIATSLTHGLVQTGAIGAGLIAPDLAGALHDPAATAPVATAVNDVRAWIARRIKEPRTLRLLTDPVGELTGALTVELAAGARGRAFALFVDTFENAAPPVRAWLLTLLSGDDYGALPADTVVAVAGQHRPDPNTWSPLWPVTADIALEPFTRQEAAGLLARHSVTNPAVVESIWAATQGLPVLVDALARAAPAGPEAVADLSGDAVERFLRQVTDPLLRRVAEAAALPRELNRDVLEAVLPEEERARSAELYAWLRTLPFVRDQAGGAHYHQVVRTLLVRLARTTSPSAFAARQTALADHRAAAGEGDLPLEEVYHRLCADPAGELPRALAHALSAVHQGTAAAHRWAVMLHDAGRDGADERVGAWGARLSAALAGERPVLAYLTELITGADLPPATLARALAGRWREHFLEQGETEAALADITRAVELDPGFVRAVATRGLTRKVRGDLAGALADYDRALELDPDYGWALGQRGQVRALLGDRAGALADLDRALALDPGWVWALGERGLVRAGDGDHAGALADLGRAIELSPDHAWALLERGRVHCARGDYGAALADLTRAVELDGGSAAALDARGQVHRRRGDYAAALADFDRAAALDPAFAPARAHRGLTRYFQGDAAGAVADLEAAVALAPEDAAARRDLGAALVAAGDVDRAVRVLLDTGDGDGTRGSAGGDGSGGGSGSGSGSGNAGRPAERDPWILLLRGLAGLRAGRGETAVRDLRAAVVAGAHTRRHAPHEEDGYLAPAAALAALGKPDRALSLVREMLRTPPPPSAVAECLTDLSTASRLAPEPTPPLPEITRLLASHLKRDDGTKAPYPP
ncbi:tetratricopeptide repeat protein [Streptomonospora sp. S1-112]|uniref:Tetratricopeptide repeat protein n=1 Tax=Streptomonospora mangrovi TaxID=2883123 RepID=A0A9X3NSR1_9ACTN|nr:tetratricopeptide repeat protein [Streptomonospora mangrovi]MDA0567369.1 tetratricopeptide repeat protein [Streptomonospora mangrovi]